MRPSQTAACSVRLVVALLLGLLVLQVRLARGESLEAEARDSETSRPAENITVYLHQSEYIETPWPVARVFVTASEVADVEVVTPQQVLVLGKSAGSTDLILWSEKEEMLRFRIDVIVDLRRMRAELEELFPQLNLNVIQSGSFLIIRGVVDRAESAAVLHKYFDAWGFKYVDMTRLAGVQQVLIKVRMAEVSRTALRSLGINAFHTGDDFFFGSGIGGLNPVSIGPPAGTIAGEGLRFEFTSSVTVGPGITLFAGFPPSDVQVFLQALAENQYLRILAEPTLVALSGEEASFLAGGEFPIPVAQGAGGGTAISVEYREFGIRLRFRPTVLGDGTIRLYVAPEVSDLSATGAVETQGFSIPAIVTRRAETTLQMKSGQTFAMAGLINRSINAQNSRLPWLGDLPVLGTLFRSVRYRQAETELVVLVTVSLVDPLSDATSPPPPGILHVPPNDWEFYLEGRIEAKGPVKLYSTDAAAALKKLGFDRLLGPGAWESYDQGIARSQATTTPTPAEIPSDPDETNSPAAQPQAQAESFGQ